MTYTLLVKKINKGSFEKLEERQEMQEMLDVFYIGNRITKVQYEELTNLLTDK